MIEAHSVGHPTMVGSPIPRFAHENPCPCGTKLNPYREAPDGLCSPCSRRERLRAAERERQESKREARKRWLREQVMEMLTAERLSGSEIARRLSAAPKTIYDLLRAMGPDGEGLLIRTGEPGGNGKPGYRWSMAEDRYAVVKDEGQ